MLHGRDAEQAMLDDLLAGARAGRSAALVIRGEAGIGKSALLDYAATQGLPTVRSAGIESESELPFAALHLLVKPGMELVGQLPPRQRDALEAAFGLGEHAPADRMLIGLAVLTLLAEEAADGPLLCIVDDAHWLDQATADALLFAARRLDAEGVVMLFAARTGPGDFPAPGLPELTLSGLAPEAAAALLDAGATRLPPATRYRLLTESGGNPLALLELPLVVGEGGVDAANPLPLTQRLQLAFHSRIARLPATTRTVLLVAAAAGTADISRVLRAATTLGAGLADLQPAQDAGMVDVDNGRLSWRHPLLRSAVYQGAALTQRLATHRALADAYAPAVHPSAAGIVAASATARQGAVGADNSMIAPADSATGTRRPANGAVDRSIAAIGVDAGAIPDDNDADLRAWHSACAATGPDEETAAALESTADRARRRNGFHGAVAAYERAAALSVDAGARVRRLVCAAETASEAGLTEQAARLADRAAAQTTGDEYTQRLELVRAQAEFASGTPGSAHRRLMSAARAAGADEPGTAARILARAVHTAWYLGPAELDEVAGFLTTLRLAEDDPATPIARYLTGSVSGRRTTDLRAVVDAARAAGADNPADLVQLCGSGLVVGQDDQVDEVAAELIAECREQGRIALLAPLLFFRAECQLFGGRPRESRVAAEEGLGIARDIGQAQWVSQLYAFLAYLAALHGDEQRCHAEAEQAVADQLGGPTAVGASWAHAARGLLALGEGRLDRAQAELDHMTVEPARHHVIGLRTLPDQIEVAVRLGATDRANEALTRLIEWSERAEQQWIGALAARGRALLAEDPEPHFRTALVGNRPFDEARTRLLYGEWLRRDKRKVDARAQLEQCADVFDRLGATPWLERARTELSALGVGTTARADDGPLSLLTPQESQIVRLAAQGLSNREIAARLFLSHRTVGHHLYKAYPKLGVVSRGELSALDLE
ncbi:helix-turn-helix transcriptional regulator [Nocardia caishijiensis]|uniref:Regulatory LuxR family protein n=1 Tax=Nocardia caishijiensis TaxID=184756 RepID=A0ABQ6YEE2_9NOCA|nr:AAA family ATPase [Nocardia caishijiensis]KAF0835787.1 regulatory LuxR family protein [Nocardia caishijiensis]